MIGMIVIGVTGAVVMGLLLLNMWKGERSQRTWWYGDSHGKVK